MNNSKNIVKTTALVFLSAGAVLAVLQAVCDYFFYDRGVFLYKQGAVIPLALNFVFLIYIAGALVFFGMKSKTLTEKYPYTSSSTKIISFLAGIALLANGISDITTLMNRKADLMYVAQRQDTFIMWSGILAAAAFLYFIVTAFVGKGRESIRVLLGCVVILWHIMHILTLYFDMTNPLNNPLRLMNEFALVAGMLFMTTELRFLIKAPKKGFYIAISLIAFALLFASAISGFVCAVLGLIPVDAALISRCYEFLLAVYIEGRLVSYLRQDEALPEAQPEETTETAEENNA